MVKTVGYIRDKSKQIRKRFISFPKKLSLIVSVVVINNRLNYTAMFVIVTSYSLGTSKIILR
jgi:hypothetical protein